MNRRGLLPRFFVGFYRVWHGKLHLKGSGLLLRTCARILPGFSRYQLAVPGVGVITINLKDSSGIAWLNYALGESGLEDGLICAITKLSPKDPIIWEVGANAGFFAAALIQCLRGYSEFRLFEPNPNLMPILQELADLLPNVHAHNLAFSDKPGIFPLYVPSRDSSRASFIRAAASLPVNVQCMTGDAFLQNTGFAAPDIIIIDTDGNDCCVINGLTKLIERKHPIIFFEHIFETAETICTTLPPGYRHSTIDDKSGELLPGLDNNRGHNSVFVPPA